MTDQNTGVRYCRGRLKRFLDLVVSLVLLVGLSPMIGSIAVLVLASMGRPVLFLQSRVGMDGKGFGILKFRSMKRKSENGLQVTGSGDPRVTWFGRWLRITKCDELPQLVNVLRGEMSIVGPRPELPRFVARYDDVQREVLKARPGLTDPATLKFRNEENLLGKVDPEERDEYYSVHILPKKLRINREYIANASLTTDLGLIVRTVTAIADIRPE